MYRPTYSGSPSWYWLENATRAVVCPGSPQCAAVTKTVDEMRVPEQYAQVPSEKTESAISAPTSGWPLPSGAPLVMADAGPAATATSATAARATRPKLVYMNGTYALRAVSANSAPEQGDL